MEENKKSAQAVEKEGKHVTGTQGQHTPANAETGKVGKEYLPKEGDKKKNMTGYNELPEQEKVGGEE
ncbi:hypothetical protein ACXYMU_08500 [Pontibacter sp. CAU 1760]